MKAIVIGAGICGPATAIALQQAGIETAIYEARRPAAADTGSYLTVATNGLDALRAIHSEDTVVAGGFATNRAVLFSATGRRLGTVPLGTTQDGRMASHTIKRARLHEALRDRAHARGIRIEFGRRLVAADLERAAVRARFDDGTSATADVLIGCDGVHSATRRTIDPSAPPPRYVGLLNFGGYTEGTVGEHGSWHMIFGTRAFFGFAPDAAGGTVWFANVPRRPSTGEERASTTTDEWKRWLLEMFEGDRGPAAELIGRGALQLAADNTYDLPSVPTWHMSRAAIIGDAAHAPSPSSGQGASMALEDGVLLAKCLRDTAAIRDAFTLFERIRRSRVERIVAQGARTSSSKAAGPFGRVLRDLVLPFVLHRFVTEKSQAWIYEHRIGWDRRLTPPRGVAVSREPDSGTAHEKASQRHTPA